MERQIYSYDLAELQDIFAELGQPPYRAKQLYEWLHTHNASSYDEMTNLPKAVRKTLSERFPLSESQVVETLESEDGTKKFLLQLSDGALVETVGIPSIDEDSGSERLTVCFSTQCGCAMGCSFCATGKEGFTRNLTSQEMIDQILSVGKEYPIRISNLVAMGQGEPFLNYEETIEALRRANSDEGIKIGARHITISTCGIIDGIDKLAEEPEQFTLALSLHSAIQSTRDLIMPKVKNQPLGLLKEALLNYVDRKKRRVTFEYLMIDGINDGPEDLEALIDYCRGLLCHVNLIPLNQVDDSVFQPSSQKTIEYWNRTLNNRHISATTRNSRGSDIQGACGQLKNVSRETASF